MSMHKTLAHRADIQQALQDHHLVHDKPSQLSDGFRSGWLARERSIRKTVEDAMKTLKYVGQNPNDKVFNAHITSSSYNELRKLLGEIDG